MRLQEHVDHATFLDHASRIEHRDAIADLLDHFHLVRDQHDRQAELAVDALQQVEDRTRGFGIERGRRFIRQQYLRLARQRASDADALLLAAADLRWIAILLRGQPDQIEQRQHGGFDVGTARTGQFERQRDVVEHRARRQQVEVLEDHADLAACLAQRTGRQQHQVAPADDDIAFVRPREQVDGAHERALAGAASADDAEHLALRDRQVDVAQRIDPAARAGETLREIA